MGQNNRIGFVMVMGHAPWVDLRGLVPGGHAKTAQSHELQFHVRKERHGGKNCCNLSHAVNHTHEAMFSFKKQLKA